MYKRQLLLWGCAVTMELRYGNILNGYSRRHLVAMRRDLCFTVPWWGAELVVALYTCCALALTCSFNRARRFLARLLKKVLIVFFNTGRLIFIMAGWVKRCALGCLRPVHPFPERQTKIKCEKIKELYGANTNLYRNVGRTMFLVCSGSEFLQRKLLTYSYVCMWH